MDRNAWPTSRRNARPTSSESAPGVRELVAGHSTLLDILEPLLAARGALREQLILLDKRVRDAAKADPVCRRLMTAPGVGAIVAMTFRAAVDQPDRFPSSKKVGACFGLTPRKYQSGETDRDGAISRAGDASVRVALFEAAHVIMTRVAKWSKLKAWAMNVAKRRGAKRAKVALARKLGVVLHRMWLDEPFSVNKPRPKSRINATEQGRLLALAASKAHWRSSSTYYSP